MKNNSKLGAILTILCPTLANRNVLALYQIRNGF